MGQYAKSVVGASFVILTVVGSYSLIAVQSAHTQVDTGGDLSWDSIVDIADARVFVEKADTPTSIAQGLGGRSTLAPGSGMLFVFTQPGRQSFWMKDMRFSIDIVWILEGKVVGIEHDIPIEPGTPDGSLKRYLSPGQVTHVLEVPGGWARENNVTIGSGVSIREK